MRSGGGKQKGSAFERTICKQLSLWVSHGEREDLFWRSAMSGGRATVGKKRGTDLAHQAGDITATHRLGHALTDKWFIECKRYRSLNFEAAILGGCGVLMTFWDQARKQAAEHDRTPMLIVRQNHGVTIVIVPCNEQLAPGAGHFLHLNPHGYLLRSNIMKADFYTFVSMIRGKFVTSAFLLPFTIKGKKQRIINKRKRIMS